MATLLPSIPKPFENKTKNTASSTAEPPAAGKATPALSMVIGVDWNICHREQDLKNFKTNQRNLASHHRIARIHMDSVFGCFPDEQAQNKPTAEYFGAVEYQSTVRRETNPAPQWFDICTPPTPMTPHTPGGLTWAGIQQQRRLAHRLPKQRKQCWTSAEKTWVEKAPTVEQRWSDHTRHTRLHTSKQPARTPGRTLVALGRRLCGNLTHQGIYSPS